MANGEPSEPVKPVVREGDVDEVHYWFPVRVVVRAVGADEKAVRAMVERSFQQLASSIRNKSAK